MPDAHHEREERRSDLHVPKSPRKHRDRVPSWMPTALLIVAISSSIAVNRLSDRWDVSFGASLGLIVAINAMAAVAILLIGTVIRRR